MEFMQEFPTSEIQHLTREGSDHCPIQVQCHANQERYNKPFRFLNFWTNHEKFHEVVKENWKIEIQGSPFHIVQQKMKITKKVLTKWSKETYGNIFHRAATMEDIVKVKEIQFEIPSTDRNRAELMKAEKDLRKFYQVEEELWKQKSGMKWFIDGDRNTKFFHSYVKGRRRRLQLNEILDEQGVLLKDKKDIGEAAVKVFEQQFKESNFNADYAMIDCIPKLITVEQQQRMDRTPMEEEVREAVFSLNSDNACGPDGFSGKNFQSCWEIIKEDFVKMVVAFFYGMELPRFVTHTNLVLLPKKEQVRSFTDLRPISLSTYINKVISKVIHGRLAEVLLEIISKKQTGFMKGRSIAKNVLLAQEIIRDINKRNQYHNIVVKLDMMKAYDRVSWVFLTKVMRRFGFTERIIDMVWRLMTNN
ncbi:hypothetical protein KY284_023708 [Solanum tuberosum]|nr:hypothetical protein KY284_023708 [Solanum tuberosum]